MRNNLLWCIFSVILLVQGICAYPAESYQESVEEEVSARDRLLIAVIADFTELADWFVEENSKVIKAALDDVKSKHEHDLTEYVTELEAYIENANKKSTRTEEEIFDLFEMGVHIVEKYDFDEIDKNNASLVEMATALKNNGHKGVGIKLAVGYLTSGETTEKKVKLYIEALTPTERIKNADIIEWYDKVQKQKDTEKKMELYGDFFELFDE